MKNLFILTVVLLLVTGLAQSQTVESTLKQTNTSLVLNFNNAIQTEDRVELELGGAFATQRSKCAIGYQYTVYSSEKLKVWAGGKILSLNEVKTEKIGGWSLGIQANAIYSLGDYNISSSVYAGMMVDKQQTGGNPIFGSLMAGKDLGRGFHFSLGISGGKLLNKIEVKPAAEMRVMF